MRLAEQDIPKHLFFGGQRVMDWRQDMFPEHEYRAHASVRWPKVALVAVADARLHNER